MNNSKRKLISVIITAIFIVSSLGLVTPAMAAVYRYNSWDGGNFGGVFLSDESHKSNFTDETKQIIAQVINPADGTVYNSDATTVMTDVELRPVYQIWITRNSMKTQPQIDANKALIHLQTEDGTTEIPITNFADTGTRTYFIQPVENLDPATTYRIFVDKGIQLGSSSTTCQYIAKFTTKAPLSVWPEGTTPEITNLGAYNLTLNWPQAAAASSTECYKVYKDGQYLETLAVDNTSYNIDSLVPDTSYGFDIKAYDKNNNEVGSISTDVRTKLAEGAPDAEAPTWSNKTLAASDIATSSLTLSWSGANDNVSVTGYQILQDGQLLTKNIGQDKSSYTVFGLTNATTYIFKVEARDGFGNWSTDGPEISVKTAYTLGAQAALAEGSTVFYQGGIAITPDRLKAANNNKVSVRDAFGEVPYNHFSEERPLEWSMLGYNNLKNAGGYFGFNFSADSAAENDVMTITLPITDTAKLADGKVGVYMLDWFWEDPARQFIAHEWEKLDATIDKEKATATVTITGGNQNIILGVLSNTYGPDGMSVTEEDRSDTPSITLKISCNSTSGLKQVGIKKEKYVSCSIDPVISYFVIKNTEDKQYFSTPDYLDEYGCLYVDTDVEKGAFYRYSIDLANTFDDYGNSPNNGNGTCRTVAGSDATALASLKQLAADSKEFAFSAGDSIDSVTQDFTIFSGPFFTTLWQIVWSSDNTDVITIDNNVTNVGGTDVITRNDTQAKVTRPEDKDTVVNLTAKVTFNGVTDTITIPVTVKKSDTPYLTDLDTKIMAGVAADTLTALKSSVLRLADVRDALVDTYQTALKAARDAKGSVLTAAEVQKIITDTNNTADVAAAKAYLITRRDAQVWYRDSIGTIDLNRPRTDYGITYTWTAVGGPDANRVTLNADGTATLNSLPAYGEAYGSITITETLTKGNATDTLDYTYELRGREYNHYAYGYITSNFITMLPDGVTPSPEDCWYLDIVWKADDGRLYANAATIKDTIGHNDLVITGLPAGLDYTVTKVGDNDVKITLTGTAKTPVTSVANIGIVVKASVVEEDSAVDSKTFAAQLNPFSEGVVIDYNPLDGLPYRDQKSHSNIGFTQFVKAAKVADIKTITLNDPIYLFNDDDVVDKSRDINHVIDLHNATIIAGADMDYLFCTGSSMYASPVVTLKNAVIDMNHKNFKTVFNAKGILHLENVSIINSENTRFGAMAWANNTKSYGNGTVNNEQFTADKCQFGPFKVAGVLQWSPGLILSELLEANSRPSQVKLTECTFNGGGLPGYGVVGCYGSIVTEGCTFTGYKGSVATGATPTTDYYVVPTKPTMVDYRLILPYSGIPNNSPSAGILLKEVAAAKRVSDNIISDCDNGILVWTGERNFHQYEQAPVSGYTAFVEVNGKIVLTQTDSAQDAYNYLVGANSITLAAGSSGAGVGIENAPDRYNRSSLLAGNETTAVTSINSAILAGNADATLTALKADAAGLNNISADNKSLYQDALAAARTTKGSTLTKAEIQAVLDQVNATTLAQDTEAVASVKTALTTSGLVLDLYSLGEINKPTGSDANGVTAQWTTKSGADVSFIDLTDGNAVLSTQPAADAANGSVKLTLTLSKGAASDTLEYTATIYPVGTGTVIIDYEAGNEEAAWTQFQNACSDAKIASIILNKPVGVGQAIKADKIPALGFREFDEDSNVIDCNGKTIKLGADNNYMLYSGEGRSITLKNAKIDLDHKNANTVIMCTGAVKLDNVKFINTENVNCGITVPDAEIGVFPGDRLIANNCQFSNFKLSALLESAAYPVLVSIGYNGLNSDAYGEYEGKINASLTAATLTNCTFNGNGQPGFGIIGCFETLTVKDCTFTGYNGAVSTGTTWSNEVFDGNPYLKYKGVPDGTLSAAILLKEVATSNLSGNTISACDNGVLVWTGERDFRHYALTPNSNWTGFVEANGIRIYDASAAVLAFDAIIKGNSISLTSGSNGNLVLIENAADRYNRTTLYTQHFTIGAPILTCDGQTVEKLEQDRTYTVTVPVSAIGGGGDIKTYSAIVLRGGKGVRADRGGTVLGNPEVKLDSGKLELTFKVPEGMTGKVYGNVIIWNEAKTYPEAEPVSFTLDIQ